MCVYRKTPDGYWHDAGKKVWYECVFSMNVSLLFETNQKNSKK